MNVANLLNEKAIPQVKGVSVIVVYENLVTGLRANEFIDQFHQESNAGQECWRSFWLLNLLRTPLLQEQAAVEASRANLIVLSLDKRTGLPEDVKEWIARWLDHKEDRAYKFGVLLEADYEEGEPVGNSINYLRDLMTAAGVEFLCWNAYSQRVMSDLSFRPEPSLAQPRFHEQNRLAYARA